MPLLHPGDRFPDLTVALPDDAPLALPEALAGHYGVVLLYRGSWCPYCQAQLRSFQRASDELDEHDIRVVALSVDDETATRELVAKGGLTFPVGHGADADAVSAAVGAFVSVYSSGAIGRLAPEDVVGLVTYAREHAPAAG